MVNGGVPSIIRIIIVLFSATSVNLFNKINNLSLGIKSSVFLGYQRRHIYFFMCPCSRFMHEDCKVININGPSQSSDERFVKYMD